MHEQKILDRHITFTNPDYVMYVPKYKDYESDNVHLHVVSCCRRQGRQPH